MSETWNPAEVEVPSRYGPDDTIGALNEITEAKVAEAAGLVRQGRRYQLAQILDDSSPAQMWRYWKHSLLVDHIFPERGFGANRQTFLEESVARGRGSSGPAARGSRSASCSTTRRGASARSPSTTAATRGSAR